MKRILTLVAAVILYTACDGRAPKPDGPATRAGLERGRDAGEAWIAAARADSVSSTTAIALGYMERLRLGLGSPFRLIDFALNDPRLDDSTRTTLAWTLLERTLDGDAYEIDGAALDRGGAGTISSWPGLGARHLEIITNAVHDAADPRSGELAVRLAYTLAATEGSLPRHATRYAAGAAALVRDRELAMRDAAELLHASEREQINAMTLLRRWRTERRLRVEGPTLAALPQDQEREALSIAPGISDDLRKLAAKPNLSMKRAATPDINATLLTEPVARRLLAIADSTPMPPLAPLVIGARGYHRELDAQPWLTEPERARRRALEKAGTEERFVAQYALLDRASAYDVIPSLVALGSAVGMRTHAQETVWYPGDGGPSARDLVQRYGLSGVSFGASVPVELRPYYRRMLDVALTDLRLVMPSLNLRGLSVRFQELGEDAGTLAMHDPRKRRLLLPPSTAAGTLTHEIAHDIDWQVALKRYRVQGDYASDRAVRAGSARGDRLALRMQDLSVGIAVRDARTPEQLAHTTRPAEILARNIDWFVTASLAQRGHVSGYLSSVQDELLTGYGTVRAPEVTGVAADAMVKILDEIAPVYPATREWFLRSYGSGRSLRSYDLARRVIEAPLPDVRAGAGRDASTDLNVFESITAARALGDAAIDAWTCRSPGGAYNVELEQARRNLVSEAASARARGYAVRRARAMMGKSAGEWVAGQLYGAPWQVEEVPEEMEVYLDELVTGARSVDAAPGIVRQDGFVLTSPSARCAGGVTFPSFR